MAGANTFVGLISDLVSELDNTDQTSAPNEMDLFVSSHSAPDDLEGCETTGSDFFEEVQMDGRTIFFIEHRCPNKRLVLKLRWTKGTMENWVKEVSSDHQLNRCYNTRRDELCIFYLFPDNSKLAIEMTDDFDHEYHE